MKYAAITLGIVVIVSILGIVILNGCDRLNEYRFTQSMRDPRTAQSITNVILEGQGLRIVLTGPTRDAFVRALQKTTRRWDVDDFDSETGPIFRCRMDWSDWITTRFSISIGKEGALLMVGDPVDEDFILFDDEDRAQLHDLIQLVSPHPPIPGDYEI